MNLIAGPRPSNRAQRQSGLVTGKERTRHLCSVAHGFLRVRSVPVDHDPSGANLLGRRQEVAVLTRLPRTLVIDTLPVAQRGARYGKSALGAAQVTRADQPRVDGRRAGYRGLRIDGRGLYRGNDFRRRQLIGSSGHALATAKQRADNGQDSAESRVAARRLAGEQGVC